MTTSRFIIAGLLAGIVVGCQSASDVKPGDGRKAIISGKSYDQIWDATVKVAGEHFEVREQDKARGVILAQRIVSAFGWGSWVGLYVTVTPPVTGATAYTIEVVRREKASGNIGEQDWEYKALRDIYRQLGLPPLDPARDP